MAVKHIQLPNNEIVDINDIRISGVDTVVTSGSNNVITSGGTYNALAAKQDTISDLATIRAGAALGATSLQSYTETDPTVPAWAKASSKPSYTFSELTTHPTTIAGYGITDWLVKYAPSDSPDTFTTSGIYRVNTPTGASGTGYDFRYGNILVVRGSSSSDTLTQLAFPVNSSNIYFRTGNTSSADFRSNPWKTIWNSANDGSDSGLDADLLDGHHNGDLTAICLKQSYSGTDLASASLSENMVKYALITGSTDADLKSKIDSFGQALLLSMSWRGVAYGARILYGVNDMKIGFQVRHAGTWQAINEFYHSGNSNLSTVDWACNTLTASGNILAAGTITPGGASDTRLKNNITSMSISRAKDIILNARPVSFTWNDTATSYFDGYKGDDFGLLAQDVEPYIPQAVGTIFEKYKRLDYTKFITPLISVAQDHESRIQQLEQKLNIINN